METTWNSSSNLFEGGGWTGIARDEDVDRTRSHVILNEGLKLWDATEDHRLEGRLLDRESLTI